MRIVLVFWIIAIVLISALGVKHSDHQLSLKAQGVRYYLDRSADLDISQATSTEFIPLDNEGIPPRSSIVWLKIPMTTEIKKRSHDVVLFSGSTEMIPTMTLYAESAGKTQRIGFCEVRLESPECLLPNLQYAFPLSKQVIDESSHLYIRATSSGTAIQNEFYFMSRPYYNRITAFLTYFMGFSCGITFLIGTLGLMIFASMRNKEVLIFSANAFAGFMTVFIYRGIWDAIRPDAWFPAADLFVFIFLITRVFELALFRSLFNVGKYHKKIDRFLKIAIALFASLAILGNVSPVAELIWKAFPIIFVIEILTIPPVCLYFMSLKKNHAVSYLLGWMASQIGLVIMTLYKFDVISDNWIYGYIMLAFRPVQLFILSFIIFERLNEIVVEVEIARVKEQHGNVIRTLLRTLSHDLSNTTNLIQLSAEVALKKLDLEPIKKTLRVILKAANDQTKIIKNAKETYLNKGGAVLKLTPVDLKECVESSLQILSHKSAKKGVIIEASYDGNSFSVLAESTSLTHQVICNLLDNAVKFTPAGKKVQISIQNPADKNLLSLEIKDEGSGMPQELADRFFTEAAKISRPDAENEKSTGLGMLVVRDFLKIYGAHAKVESRVNA
ncbi:MAG: ATP-binding protein, partial [Pseudobdellovibrionaceae bacterium]